MSGRRSNRDWKTVRRAVWFLTRKSNGAWPSGLRPQRARSDPVVTRIRAVRESDLRQATNDQRPTINESKPPHQRLQPDAVRRGEAETGAVLQGDDVLALEGRLEVDDAVDVDDGRAVDADEAAGVELGLEVVQRLAHVVNLASEVQADVVP